MMINNVAQKIDHTLLKPDATEEQVVKLAKEAIEYNFIAVCVNPCWVKTAYQILKDTQIKVATVIGFPLGATTTAVKVYEASNAIKDGAAELDMVINVGALRDRDDDYVENDIRAVVNATNGKALVKVIIETSLLTQEEKVRACRLAVSAGAEFVKTSTGFSTGGATIDDVSLMRATVGENVGVKASGGIKTLSDALLMIQAGANRIGTSSGTIIVKAATK